MHTGQNRNRKRRFLIRKPSRWGRHFLLQHNNGCKVAGLQSDILKEQQGKAENQELQSEHKTEYPVDFLHPETAAFNQPTAVHCL